MDLMRMLAGDPLWCSARVLQEGRDIIVKDARTVKDHVGPVAGDTVFPQFAFPNAVQASFTSSQSLRETIAGWGIEVIGTKAVARLNCDVDPNVFLRSSTPWTAQKGKQDAFTPLVPELLKNPPAGPFDAVGDWLAAIREQRIPLCSAENAAWAVEMVISVYHSALTGKRAYFPLSSRSHPLRPA
jgi:predicted dehydrogenase